MLRPHPQAMPGPPAAPADFSQAPMVLFWELTRACALKCLHCRASAQPQRHPLELTTQEGFQLLDELASWERRPILVITGGDPFMRRDLLELVGHGIARGLRVSLSPSATRLVTRQALRELASLGISRLSFSLDGSTPEIHDTFRGVPGVFQRTLECLADAQAEGLALHVNTTVCRYNLADLPHLSQLLCTLPGIVLWDLFFLVPTGRGLRDDVISPADHEGVYRWLYDLAGQVPFGVKTSLGQPYRRVILQRSLEEGKDPQGSWDQVARSATNDGKGVCFVSHLGQVCPSGFLPIPCGDLRQQSVAQVYRSSPVFQALRDPDRLKGKCGRCPFRALCGGCRARAYAYSGDFLEAEPCCVYQPP